MSLVSSLEKKTKLEGDIKKNFIKRYKKILSKYCEEERFMFPKSKHFEHYQNMVEALLYECEYIPSDPVLGEDVQLSKDDKKPVLQR